MKIFARFIPVAALVFTVACGRTDAGITTDVKTRLAADDAVKAYQVDVDTRDKVVTLSGTVETTLAKQQAVLLAHQADGVREVVDNILVNETAGTSGRGVDIDVDVDAKTKADAKDGAEAVADGAKEVGHGAKEVGKEVGKGATEVGKEIGKGAKKGAEAVADGAKKVGSTVKDAVTDDDPDSDKDGK